MKDKYLNKNTRNEQRNLVFRYGLHRFHQQFASQTDCLSNLVHLKDKNIISKITKKTKYHNSILVLETKENGHLVNGHSNGVRLVEVVQTDIS